MLIMHTVGTVKTLCIMRYMRYQIYHVIVTFVTSAKCVTVNYLQMMCGYMYYTTKT